MNISKTLFKTISRCNNALSLYDMYLNQLKHHVKEINGLNLDELKNNLKNISNNLLEEEQDIFENMFDTETGDDLTILTSPQMEAFKNIFKEVELLAGKHIEKILNHKVIMSSNTFEQKKFSFNNNGNTYYCYLDIYYEEDNHLKIYEVKSTTSRKFDELTFGKSKKPVFSLKDGIMNLNIVDENKNILDDKSVERVVNKILDQYSDVGKYFFDISLQKYIIENNFYQLGTKPPIIDYYLVVLNHEYSFSGKYNNGVPVYETDYFGNELFKIYECNTIGKLYETKISKMIEKINDLSEHLVINSNCFGKQCEYKKTTQCKFYNICGKCLEFDGSILEYLKKNSCFKDPVSLKTLDKYDLINKRIYSMNDASIYAPKLDNKIQLECFLNKTKYIDINRIKPILENIQYPIYHIDYESYNSPLPRFKGEHPYSQSVFQYSLHIEKEPGVCDLEKDHYEFLAKDHLDHRREFAEQLVDQIDLSNGGTVMVYNDAFEKTRNSELARLYPDLKDKIININNHILDLLKILNGSKDFYLSYDKNLNFDNIPSFSMYDNGLHGSFSIKKVLPIYTNLSYSSLNVKNGTEAILAYGSFPYLSRDEYEKTYNSLRVYCRQDTWSMVMILDGLRKEVGLK